MSDYSTLWDCTLDLADDLELNVPGFASAAGVTEPHDVVAIWQGGCASGACMPAVTYYRAAEIMHEYGDEVLEYIQDTLGELPKPPAYESWSGFAVFYLSYAIDLWCSEIIDEVENAINEHEEKENEE